MAWNDLSIAQRSQLMNLMRHNGILNLSEMRRLYDLSSPSLSSLGENTFNMQPQAPVYDSGGDKTPYNGEIRQGKKWNFIDHYLANNPQTAHRLRKAGALLSDAARLIPGINIRDVEINPRKVSDYGDTINAMNKDGDADNVMNRVSGGTSLLGAVAKTAKPIVDELGKDFPNWKWTPRITNLTNDIINVDRLINMGQFIDDFATPVNQFKKGGDKDKTNGGGDRNKRQNWFTRATLGAMMADSPAVAQASGWKYGNNGLTSDGGIFGLDLHKNGGYLFDDSGPEEDSGFNAGQILLKRLKRKYLSDYAKNGFIYGYPTSIRELVHYGLSPYFYKNTKAYKGRRGENRTTEEETSARRALFAKYFGIDPSSIGYGDAITKSSYTPSISSDKNAEYYTVPIENAAQRFDTLRMLMNNYKHSIGEDEKGRYISVYDIWDLAPLGGQGNEFPNSNPVEIYDRFYEYEMPDSYRHFFDPESISSNSSAPSISFSSGGKIHIKPENRGNLFDGGGDKDKKRNNKLRSWLTDKAVDYFYNTTFKPAIKKYGIDGVRLRLYDHILPFGYDNAKLRVESALGQKPLSNNDREYFTFDNGENTRYRDDIWRRYLGVPEEKAHGLYAHHVIPSLYSPTVKGENHPYYAIHRDDMREGDKVSQIVNAGIFGSKEMPISNDEINPLKYGETRISDVMGRYFGDHTISRGVDPERGDYISYYDLWDIAPMSERGAKDQSHGIGTPLHFYDRFYLDDYFGVDSRPKNPDEFYGGYITPTVFTENRKYGGRIHIKPENRGKFTALKKRTGHSASWFKAHGTPAQKKMAVFALNAKKWKHEHGGIKF